jgi:hypothetical protein
MPMSEYKSRQLPIAACQLASVCNLCLKDGLYSFEVPPKLPGKFKKNIAQLERKLLASNNTQTRKLMASAKKNADFVERFNSELFFKHSFYKGQRLNAKEVLGFYGTDPYNKIVNLSGEKDKMPFIALYAMTFYACTCEDLFTVDGIFSMQPERHSDNAKKTAGNGVFNLILRGNPDEIKQVVLDMGQTLIKIPPLRVNLADAAMLAKNYTLFAGVSEMARIYMKSAQAAALNDFAAAKAAEDLLKYSPLVNLCDTIAVLSDNEDYRETMAYKNCKEFM